MNAATLQALLGTAAFALLLGAFGPALDAGPYDDAPASAFTQDELAGPVARLEAEARQRCTTAAGVNAGWITTSDGQVRCTDKHGRVHRTATSTTHRRSPQ